MSKGFHIPKLFNYRIAFYQGCFPLLSLQMTIMLCGIQLRSSALEYIKIKSNFYCVSTVSQTLFFIYPLVRASACMLSCFSHVQSTLCGPMDYGLPGSSVHGILQARILKWVAVPSSRGLPDPGSNLSLLRLLGNLSMPLGNMNWELATHWIPYKIPRDNDKKTCPMPSAREHFLILYWI